jgi:hypothetical protein
MADNSAENFSSAVVAEAAADATINAAAVAVSMARKDIKRFTSKRPAPPAFFYWYHYSFQFCGTNFLYGLF